MSSRNIHPRILNTITEDVLRHPKDLTRYVAESLQISRQAANNHIRRLEKAGWIARSGPATRPVFSPGYKRQAVKSFPLEGLEEDLVWSQHFMPFFSLRPNVLAIVNHGFTEMLNNAIDHSAGSEVFILARQTEEQMRLLIADNGMGIFAKIARALDLPDMRQALFELSKGKFTTDPSRHTGEGVFFTSRMFDRFQINANGLEFSHDQGYLLDLLQEAPRSFEGGTLVSMEIALGSGRTTNDVYQQFTNAPEDFDFSRTVVPMRLARLGDEQLVSRSQAKRLIARFDRFKTVVLDFDGVQEIGQAFADEIFRVYANSHPGVELVPQGMTEQVERMWLRAVSPRM